MVAGKGRACEEGLICLVMNQCVHMILAEYGMTDGTEQAWAVWDTLKGFRSHLWCALGDDMDLTIP